MYVVNDANLDKLFEQIDSGPDIPDTNDIDEILKLLQITGKDSRKGELIKEAWSNTPNDKRTPLWLDKLLMHAGVGASKRVLAITAMFGKDAAEQIYPDLAPSIMQSPVAGVSDDQMTKYAIDQLIRERINLARLKMLDSITGSDNTQKRSTTTMVMVPTMDKDGNMVLQQQPMEMDPNVAMIMNMMMIMMFNNNNGHGNKDEYYEMKMELLKKELELKNTLLEQQLKPIIQRAQKTPDDYFTEMEGWIERAKKWGIIDQKEMSEKQQNYAMFKEGMGILKEAIENVARPISAGVGQGLKESIRAKMRESEMQKNLNQKITVKKHAKTKKD